MTVRRTPGLPERLSGVPHPPTRAMRENPDIDQLKRQAKELLDAFRASTPEAITEVTSYHRNTIPESFALHDAQFGPDPSD